MNDAISLILLIPPLGVAVIFGIAELRMERDLKKLNEAFHKIVQE